MSANECRLDVCSGGVESLMNIRLGHHKVSVVEARAAYSRWGPMVLRFCELFLGDTRLAEQATIETFVRFLGSSHRGETSGVPVALLSLAFRVVSQSSTANPERLEPLKGATLGLDPVARAVFILHAVLSIQWPWIGAILGLSSEQVTDVWAKTLLRIRERLPEDFFKEQRR